MDKLLILVAVIMSFGVSSSEQKIRDQIKTKGSARVVIALDSIKSQPETDLKSINQAIKLKQSRVLRDMSQHKFDLIHQYQSVSLLAVKIYDNQTLEQFKNHPEVLAVSLDEGGVGQLNESGPFIEADFIQNLGLTGSGVKIAVLDSGYDSDHSALSDDLVAEHCVCTSCCPSGGNTQTGIGSAEDDHGHGTHVSGIITGNGNSSPLGIAPDTDIVAVKVLNSSNSFCCSSDIIAAMDWVLNNQSDVAALSMSLGTSAEFNGDCDNATAWTMGYASVIESLRAQGISTIVASMNSGNTSGMGVPACISGSIAVGASFDNSDTVASFSNSSTSLDILAPGVSITSSQMGGGSVTFSGTSMATPHVSAVAALMLQLYPNLTITELESCLLTSSVQIFDPRNSITRPRLNAVDAIACIDTIYAGNFD